MPMKPFFTSKPLAFLTLTFLGFALMQAQVYEYSTQVNGQTQTHRILMDEAYIVETVFVADPPLFIKAVGGFYKSDGNHISADLEFNSDYAKDSLSKGHWMRTADWKKVDAFPLALNGKWLMAGRVTDQGERRRDLSGPRKTMKFLVDGHFQWIAFNTTTFQFFGSGGGTYTAVDGKYTEQIDYFSRDNSRVGAALPFEFIQKENDWYHKGKSSKGDPMHEVWTKRMQ